jgi:hypothetical protein
MAMGLMTFVIIALWLQLNTGADRVIQRQLGTVEWMASAGVDYVLDLLPKPTVTK